MSSDSENESIASEHQIENVENNSEEETTQTNENVDTEKEVTWEDLVSSILQ